jgi:hypothetical protein
MAKKQRAAEQQVKRWAEYRRQRDEQERRQRVMVITEFGAGDPEATMHAMATEILRCETARGRDRVDEHRGAVWFDSSRSLLASEARQRG